jgi:predicted dehydrogenase/threonine dehydrogenase-like Zn-dependent dehydrogenase
MGYCNVGRVTELGAGVCGFAIGDRVVSNGKHAEFVAVPENLCARVPECVGDDSAAFTVLGAVALQGIRLAQPTLGECVVVTGLGIVGLLTVQLLKAHGCRVLALDFDAGRVQLARAFGADAVDLSNGGNPLEVARHFSRGRGVDAAIVTASTKSSEPLHEAAVMCRKRGRIVLVGVTGMELSRADFYEKELSFQVSCSYGPGRYDPEYEEKGHDYPLGYVRWTEQRNFEAVLDMMADGRIDVSRLITHRFPVDRACDAYELIASPAPSLGVVLEYPTVQHPESTPVRTVAVKAPSAHRAGATLGFIGAGSYASGVLIPAFKDTGARLKAVSSANGVSSTYAARKFGIEVSTTDARSVLADPEVDGVIVSTRHSSHARWVCEALAAGKHVFVEKPLAMSLAELDAIRSTHEEASRRRHTPVLTVGFNRRFAPHTVRMAQLLEPIHGPKSFVMTVNAGSIPAAHWTQDPEVGGGRIVGEACHFIDLLRFLAKSPIASVKAIALRSVGSAPFPDTCTITLTFKDGSIGAVHYFSNGHKALAKERLEVFAQGKVVRLDNFRYLEAHGWRGQNMRLWRQDKGQSACAAAFVRAIESDVNPIPLDELYDVARATIEANEAIASR